MLMKKKLINKVQEYHIFFQGLDSISLAEPITIFNIMIRTILFNCHRPVFTYIDQLLCKFAMYSHLFIPKWPTINEKDLNWN